MKGKNRSIKFCMWKLGATLYRGHHGVRWGEWEAHNSASGTVCQWGRMQLDKGGVKPDSTYEKTGSICDRRGVIERV